MKTDWKKFIPMYVWSIICAYAFVSLTDAKGVANTIFLGVLGVLIGIALFCVSISTFTQEPFSNWVKGQVKTVNARHTNELDNLRDKNEY